MSDSPTPASRRLWLLALVAALAVVALVIWRPDGLGGQSPGRPTATSSDAPTSQASSRRTSQRTTQSSLPEVSLADLPAEAREIHRALLAGGPFRYGKDGSVHLNRNGLLPKRPRGYYREFTVPTPGESDRGARRIVVGGCGAQVSQGSRPRTEPCTADDEFYWTDDHYQSFKVIR